MNELAIHPVFLGLTRPAMLFGVSLDYLGLCGIVVMSASVFSPLYLLLMLPLYVIGWMACYHDPYTFTLLMKRAKCPRTVSFNRIGVQHYGP